MLLIHLLLSSVSVECTSCDSFLRLFRNYVFTIISFFQKLIKGGVGIRAGGLENFSKINKRGGGRLFGAREYMLNLSKTFPIKMHKMLLPYSFQLNLSKGTVGNFL